MSPFPTPSTAAYPAERFASVANLAATQHGVVSRLQLLERKCPESWIRDQLMRGTLHVVHEGVYAVGHTRISCRGQANAALLRAGDGSVISHVSAARAWRIVNEATGGPIHVSLAKRRGLGHTPGVRVHRPRSLPASDITTHRGLSITTPERTLRDLLPGLDVAATSRMLEQMVTVLNRSPDDLHAWGATLGQVRNRGTLLRAFDEVAGPAVIRSELEAQFRSLCQDAGLPLPLTNVRVDRWELDCLWVDHGVVMELDSWRWHGGRWAFHRDRRKGLALSRLGFEVLRATWPQLKYDRADVAATLHAVLARRLGQRPAATPAALTSQLVGRTQAV